MIIHEESAVRLRPCQAAERAAAGKRLPGDGDDPAPDADARLQQHRAAKIRASNPDIVIPANYYNEYVLLARTMQQQKVRPKAIYSVLGGAASSYKFVKEFPDAAQCIMDCNHWFNPKDKALDLKKRVEAKGEFFTYEIFMNYSARAAAGRRAGAGRERRPRQDHRGAGDLHVRRPLHAVRPDEVRQRPEPGRRAGEDAGARQRHPGDLPGAIASARPVFPMPPAGAGRQRRRATAVASDVADALAVILVPAVLNGLLTGAVYALVALGLTLIYGVLHIINFAHGALLTARCSRRSSPTGCSGSIPTSRRIGLTPAVLCSRLCAAALRHRPRRHGEDRNILLVTLGLAIVIENALLYAFRADTRTIEPALHASTVVEIGPAFLARAARDRLRGRARGRARCCWLRHALHRHRQGDPRGRQGEARRASCRHRRRAHLRHELRPRHRVPRDRGVPAAADLLRQSAGGQRLRAGRLHHRRARRHGLGRGRARRRPADRRGGKSSAGSISASRSARSAFS